MAAPIARPTIPTSLMGVSTTRCGPYFCRKPLGDFERALVLGDLFADDEHVRVAVHLFGQRERQRVNIA
jgi:hypothetical protein